MTEHMYSRAGNSSVPTLTDHFKQALSVTRAQMQAGPSPLTSASQMGVGSNPFANQINTSHPVPLTANVQLPPVQDVLYGAPQLPNGDVAESSGGIFELFMSYGKWILLALLVAGAIGAYFWWKKRKSEDIVEDLANRITDDLPPQRSIQRPIHRLNNPPNLLTNQPFGPSRFSANPPSSPLPPVSNIQPQSLPENLRDNEQRTSVRGAEFSNPSIMSQMVPMSTRLKPPEPTQSMPPTDLPRQQPLPTQQPLLTQQQPILTQQQPILTQQPVPTQPLNFQPPPVLAPPLQAVQPILPLSEPTQLVAPSLPVSQPVMSVEVPISNNPQMSVPIQQSDPNFTAI